MCNAWKYANTGQLASRQAASKNKPKDDCSALPLLKLNFNCPPSMPYFLIEVDVATYQVSLSSMTHRQQQSVFSDQHETNCESQVNVKAAVLITTVLLDINYHTHSK